MATQLASPHRFTADDYDRMAELGILSFGPTELIDGQIVANGRPWRFSTEDYYRLAEAGILSEDDRVELLEGEIIDMSPIGSPHAACVSRLTAFFAPRTEKTATFHAQNPLRLRDGTELQPDVMLLQYRADFYAASHPTPADVLLLIEVADTSIAFDRIDKADRYAAEGVPEYWIADLAKKAVLVHTAPSSLGYRSVEVREYGDSWSPRSLPELSVSGSDIFG
jgi:Uma2 family endonuclease